MYTRPGAFLFSLFAVVAQVMALSSEDRRKISMPSTWEEFTLHHKTFDNLFSVFKKAFNKSFLSQQDEKRHFDQFVTRAKDIFDWNDAKNVYTRTYVKGINRMTDLSVEERRNFVMPETPVDVRSFSMVL
jgi:hypothetical protein